MTNRPTPLALGKTRAAALLDLKPSEFQNLVERRVLPEPVDLAGYERWRVADLQAVLDGSAMDDDFRT